MTIRGRPIETSFTPAVAGVVRVTVNFSLWWSVGFASGIVFREQSGTTLYGSGAGLPPKLTQQAFTASSEFPVTAGSLVKVGLAADSGSPYWMVFEDLTVTAKFFPS